MYSLAFPACILRQRWRTAAVVPEMLVTIARRCVSIVHASSTMGKQCLFPSPLAKNFDLIRAPSVIGCGLLWPEGVFFTLDGVYNNSIYPFSQAGLEEGDCLPYITYPSMKVNYGQEEFLMERANSSGQRLASAQLLHSFSRHFAWKIFMRNCY